MNCISMEVLNKNPCRASVGSVIYKIMMEQPVTIGIE